MVAKHNKRLSRIFTGYFDLLKFIYSVSFRSSKLNPFLAFVGGSQYKEINEEEVKNVGVEADISLISSTVVANLSCATDTDVEDRAIMARDPLTIAERNANYDFSEISFKGLQPNIGNTPVEKASIGRKGTPSGGYEHPSSKKLS